MTRTATPGRTRSARTTIPATPVAAVLSAIAVTCLFPSSARGFGRDTGDVSLGLFSGAIALDPDLRNYRWNTSTRPVWGGLLRVDLGRVTLGARVWRAATEQSLHLLDDPRVPEVRLTGSELTTEVRLLDRGGVRLFASGATGALHLGYSPDAIDVSDGSGGSVHVDFAPITEGLFAFGLGARRAVGSGLAVTVSVDHSWFRLDTSHRRGSEIVTRRESFGHWTARLDLTRRIF